MIISNRNIACQVVVRVNLIARIQEPINVNSNNAEFFNLRTRRSSLRAIVYMWELMILNYKVRLIFTAHENQFVLILSIGIWEDIVPPQWWTR